MIFKRKNLCIATVILACASAPSAFSAQQHAEKTTKNQRNAKPVASAKTQGKVAHTVAKNTVKPATHYRIEKAVAKPNQGVRKVLTSAHVEGPLALGSASALVFDTVTGNPVFQKNPNAVMPIASISKLMTAMVVLDAQLPMDETITISAEDVDTLKGSHSRLPVGAAMTRETAMLLALMSSDNRAAHALARHYPGGLHAFVAAMNEKTRALGMTESRFLEPTGLSSRNVSTAQDLARMVMAAANYSKIRELSTTTEAKIQIGSKQLDFRNTNALTRSPGWDIGVSKTGYISEAGRCLVMHARVAERPVVIVLLDSVGKMTRVGDAVRIKRWMEQASSGRQNSRHA